MIAYLKARRAFEACNIAGKCHARAIPLNSKSVVFDDGVDLARTQLLRTTPRSGVQTFQDGIGDTAKQLSSLAKMTWGAYFDLVRSLPLPTALSLVGVPVAQASLGSLFLSSVLPLHPWAAAAMAGAPVADLLLGRGDNVLTPSTHSWFPWGDTLHRAGRYGLAGSILEAGPKKAAEYFAAKQSHKMAAACMFAAVAGRSLLQAPRLVALAAAVVSGAVFVCISTSVLAVASMTRPDLSAVFTGSFSTIHDNSPWPTRRAACVAKRLDYTLPFLRRVGAPFTSNSDIAVSRAMLVKIEADLQYFCAHHPDVLALHGGMERIAAEVAELFPAGEVESAPLPLGPDEVTVLQSGEAARDAQRRDAVRQQWMSSGEGARFRLARDRLKARP